MGVYSDRRLERTYRKALTLHLCRWPSKAANKIFAQNGDYGVKHNIAEFIGTISDGGAETLVKDYAFLLDKDIFNVFVIVLRRTRDAANDALLSQANVEIIEIYKRNDFLSKVIQKLNRWWYLPYRLKKLLKERNIEALHIHLAFLKYISPIRKKIKNVKLFYTCHNEPQYFIDQSVPAEYRAAKILIKDNHLQLIALHDEMRKEINSIFEIDNTVVIRNGIDFNRFKVIKETKEEIRKSLEIPQDAFVLGHIGRFSDQKNHTFLIDVFSEVYKENKNAFLLLIGAGELLNTVKTKVDKCGLKNRVMILSHRSDIPQLLKAMDVFVFPSLFEGLGIVLIEAQVSGLRCIISDTVPREAFQSELAVPMSLQASPDEWRDIILDESVKGPWKGKIELYNMNREIKYLEQLYLGKSMIAHGVVGK